MVSEDPDALPAVLRGGEIHPGLAAVGSGPELVIWVLPLPGTPEGDADPLARLHSLTRRTLDGLQQWLARADA